jgi:protein involved in ribonucleotide reduction
MSRVGGILYAIAAEGTGFVKIGSTRGTVEKRLRDLQTGQPFVLAVLATMVIEQDLRQIEQAVHTFLAHEHRRGEWFAVSIADSEQFEQLVARALQWFAKQSALPQDAQKAQIVQLEAQVAALRADVATLEAACAAMRRWLATHAHASRA